MKVVDLKRNPIVRKDRLRNIITDQVYKVHQIDKGVIILRNRKTLTTASLRELSDTYVKVN